jgi:hypothetical protein
MTKVPDTGPVPETLEEEVRSVKKAFEVLLLAIEAEGIASATEIAGRIVDRLDHIILELKNGYVQKILENKFRPFMEDRQRFAAYKSAEGKKTSEEFIELVSRLERHIAAVDREVKILIPQPPIFSVWYRRNKRMLAITLATAAAVGVIALGVRRIATSGKGLMGEYYSGMNFRKLESRRRDLTIDFVLRNKAPIRRLSADNFSVRWSGYLRIPEDGTYEFITRSDDGVHLWIDNKMVIDNWTVHRAITDKATMELKAGSVPIKLEWYQKRGPATMQLYWRSGSDAQPRLIEPEYLLPRG